MNVKRSITTLTLAMVLGGCACGCFAGDDCTEIR